MELLLSRLVNLMIMISTIMVFFIFVLFFISLTTAITFYSSVDKKFFGSVDRRIRQCLLGSLKRFHSELPSLVTPMLLVSEGSTKHYLYHYPYDFKRSFFESQLDAKTLTLLSQTSKYFHETVEAVLIKRLSDFNPHYATKDLQVNTLLLSVLDEHFPASKTLKSPQIHDELFLIIMKFNYDLLNYDSIPRNIYFYLIAFIHETVYGLDSSVPTSISQCKIDLVRHLRLKKHSMARSYEFLIEREREHSEADIAVFDNWKRNLTFIIDSPSSNGIKNHFNITESIMFLYNSLEKEIYVAILESLINEISDEHLSLIIHELHIHGIFSQVFFDRYAAELSLFRLQYFLSWKSTPFDDKVAACKLFQTKYSSFHKECYVYSRNIQNELDPLKLDVTHEQNMLSLTTKNRQNLYNLEMFSLFIRSEKPYPSDRILYKLFVSGSDITLFFEMTIKEHIADTPSIFLDNGDSKLPIFGSASSIFQQEHFIRSFMGLLNSTDPFIFLTMSLEALKEFKAYIIDQFSLDLVYHFDLNSSEWYFFQFIQNKFKKFIGRTVSFKQIVNELAIPGLKEIFTLTPHVFDDTCEQSQTCSSPISFTETVRFQYFLNNQ